MSDNSQSANNSKEGAGLPGTGNKQAKQAPRPPVSQKASAKPDTPKPKKTEVEKPEVEKPEDSAVPVKRGALVVFLIIGMSLFWYLLADRYAPYTSQARVQGYIVGVAPKVSGLVTKVYVKNNQEVAADQPLFEIDSSQYEIALNKAQ